MQAIPHLGASAGQLYVFQRTPSSIDVRDNRPTDQEWVKTLKPGWQKRRADNFNILTAGGYQEEDLVSDGRIEGVCSNGFVSTVWQAINLGWTSVFTELVALLKSQRKKKDAKPIKSSELLQLADFRKMNSIRKRVDDIVEDPKTAEGLKPYYNQFCKRPCFHDECELENELALVVVSLSY